MGIDSEDSRLSTRFASLPDRKHHGRHRLHALWALALGTSLRQGAALALKWADVNLDAGTVAIRDTLRRVQGGGSKLAPPKSKRARRTVNLPA